MKEQDEENSPDVSIINGGATENMIGSSHSVQAQLVSFPTDQNKYKLPLIC